MRCGDPVVVRATVAKTDLFHPYNDRNENEVIYFAGDHAVVDGDLTDWTPAASRRAAESEARNNAIRSAIHGTRSVAMVTA